MKRFLILVFTFIFWAGTAFSEEINYQKELQNALNKYDIKKAEECLQNGAKIDELKECYLCYSIIRNKKEAFDFLLKNGANPDGTTKMWTPLYFAIPKKDNEFIDKLLEYGADPNKETTVPLLYHSVVQNNPYAFEKLLYKGADPKKTFMKINAIELAFSENNAEIIDTIIKFQQKDFKTPPTDIEASIELLKTTKNGKPFYDAIKGANELKKPIAVKYIDLSTFGNYNTDVYFSITYLKNKELTIFIDNKYAHEPKEVIALLAAGNSIHTDRKNSQTEYLFQFGAQALIYEEFLIKNPKLKDNKDSRPIQTYFNPALKLIQNGKYDMNALWLLTFSDMFNKNLRETSPGFKNKDLNSYFEPDAESATK